MQHDVYTHDNFYEKFEADLDNCKMLMLGQSAFIAYRRVRKLEGPIRRALSRGVRICLFAQQPEISEEQKPDAETRWFSDGLQLLRSWKVHVTLKSKVHEKLAIFDDRVLWEGTLNYLSYRDTRERINRWTDSYEKLIQAIFLHELYACAECSVLRLHFAGSVEEKLAQIGGELATVRKQLGFSQRDLAQILELNPRTIQQMEAGSRAVRIDNLLKVADFLRLHVMPVPWFLAPNTDRIIRRLDRENFLEPLKDAKTAKIASLKGRTSL
jgi:transcriptional regulator with XRE-family HTH domain